MSLAALRQVTLVILFRAPEFRCRLDLGHDRAIGKSRGLPQFFFRLLSRRFLLRRMIKNR